MIKEIKLSSHFTLEEMCRSGVATRHKIKNIPDVVQTEHLRRLCLNVLEPLRRRFGVIRITSGFRSPELNERVGGVRSSQHLRLHPKKPRLRPAALRTLHAQRRLLAARFLYRAAGDEPTSSRATIQSGMKN